MKLRTRLVAAALAGLVPAGVLATGGTRAAFTDTARLSQVRLATGTIPAVTLRCVQSGIWPARDATLAWDPAPAGGPFTYRLVVTHSGSVKTDTSVGGSLSWDVPQRTYSTGGTQIFTAQVFAVSGTWSSPASNTVSFWATAGIFDEGC